MSECYPAIPHIHSSWLVKPTLEHWSTRDLSGHTQVGWFWDGYRHPFDSITDIVKPVGYAASTYASCFYPRECQWMIRSPYHTIAYDQYRFFWPQSWLYKLPLWTSSTLKGSSPCTNVTGLLFYQSPLLPPSCPSQLSLCSYVSFFFSWGNLDQTLIWD